MLYAGLDLSRQRFDVHVLDEEGRTIEVTAVRPDADALREAPLGPSRRDPPPCSDPPGGASLQWRTPTALACRDRAAEYPRSIDRSEASV